MTPKTPRRDRRTLALPAALISLILPGFGHFLLRQWLRGTIWLAGVVLLASELGRSATHFTFALSVIAAVDAYLIAQTLDGTGGAEPHPPTRIEDRR